MRGRPGAGPVCRRASFLRYSIGLSTSSQPSIGWSPQAGATVRGRDYDGVEATLRGLSRHKNWRRKGAQRTTFGALSRDEVLARRDQAKADLDAFIAASDADLAPLLHQALQAPIADYEVLKAKAGRLDFLDLLIKARDLLLR